MDPVAKTRNYLIAICGLFSFGILLSLVQDIKRIRQDRYLLAVSTGKVLFRTVVATRSWNASHGGVYVPVTESVRPNIYLAAPDRDVKTTAGTELTKVNPAYMTRLVGEILKKDGYVVHITSLRALRPGNEPNEWERGALERFEKGGPVAHSLVGPPGNRIFRYMEPLMTVESCLPCHGRQGYKVGDVRGGISIAFPYAAYEESIAAAIRKTIFMHLGFLGIMLAVLLFLGHRLVELVRNLQEAHREIRTLEGILPICSFCKKIRKEGEAPDDPTEWVPVDAYITGRSQAKFSHSICPECMTKNYGPGGAFGIDPRPGGGS